MTISDDNTILSESLTVTNKLVAKYKLYAVGDSDVFTEIEVKQYDKSDVDSEFHVRALKNNDIKTEINVVYSGYSDVITEIQPYGFEQIETEVSVRPHNRMWALYDVVQPPLIDNINNPIMDAFTRSENTFSSINYGTGTSMVVGRLDGHTWSSYLKFDVAHINSSLPITGSKLRLHYTGSIPQLNIEVYDLNKYWQEYSITHLNAPVPQNLIKDVYVQNVAGRYIDIDVSDKVLEWINNPTLNQGFMIKISDDSPDGQMIFRTRESYTPPELIVTHYDTSIFSTGRSEIVTEIKAMKASLSEVNTEVTVKNTFDFYRLDAEIYVHRIEVPIDIDIETEITASSPLKFVEIVSAIRSESNVKTEINIISGENVSKVDTEINVSRPVEDVEIYVKHQNKVDVEITPKLYGEDSILTEIISSKPDINVEITALITDDVLVEITSSKPNVNAEITVLISNDVEVEIDISTVRINKVDVEIGVSRRVVPIEITPRVTGLHEVYTRVDISKSKVEVEISTPERSELLTEIDIIQWSAIPVEISATFTKIKTEITPRVIEHTSVDTEIYVKWTDDIEVEITSRSTSSVNVEINVRATSNTFAEITVSKRVVLTEIIPRVFGEHKVNVTIEPRIQMVDNLDTIITVGGEKGAYGFVM